MKPCVTVIDYGMGNLLSVTRALEHCGADVKLTADHGAILASSKVVLPGVGAFGDGMAELRRQGLDAIIQKVAARRIPLLGICLGMQMLLDESEEFGLTTGLGLIPGRVEAIPARAADGSSQKVPHIGWNALVPAHTNWENSLLHGIKHGEAVYFVHSYMATPSNPDHRIADCLYGGIRVAAVIEKNRIFGCQFHPEKSGTVGLAILNNFLRMT